MRIQALIVLSFAAGAAALKGEKRPLRGLQDPLATKTGEVPPTTDPKATTTGTATDPKASTTGTAADPKGTGVTADPKGTGVATDPKGTGAAADPKGTGVGADPKGTGAAADPKGTGAATDPKATKTTETGAPKDAAKDIKATKSENALKAAKDKVAKEAKEKDVKTKKCKVAKKSPKGELSTPTVQTAATAEEQYCLNGALTSQECAAIQQGQVPDDDRSVDGEVQMELMHDTDADQVLSSVQEILRNTVPLRFVGCTDSARFLQSDVANENTTNANDAVAVTGVEFGTAAVSDEECTTESTASSCHVIQTDVQIFYQGDMADEADEEEMFALLAQVIKEQAEAGAFSSIGTVGTVEASGDGSSGAKALGIPLGAVGGVIALIGAILVGCYCYKKHSVTVISGDRESGKNPETDDSSNEGDGRGGQPVMAEATLVSEYKDKYYNKK